MNRESMRTMLATALSAGVLCWAGCDATDNETAAARLAESQGRGAPPPPGGPGGGPPSPIRALMRKLDDRRPGGLTKDIVEGLKPEQPDWPTLEKQAGEYARLTEELDRFDPPRGSKESWTRLTSAFHESAIELDQAVRAKKRDDAVASSGSLSNSCMGCHREHRRMRGGGPPPGGGPPLDGPPRG